MSSKIRIIKLLNNNYQTNISFQVLYLLIFPLSFYPCFLSDFIYNLVLKSPIKPDTRVHVLIVSFLTLKTIDL